MASSSLEDFNGILPTQTGQHGLSACERRIYVAVMYQALADLEGGHDAKTERHPTEMQRHLRRVLPGTIKWFLVDDELQTWIRHETIYRNDTVWLPNRYGNLQPITTRSSATLRTLEPVFFPFSFEEVCAKLNLDRLAIRKAVKQWIALTERGIPIRIGLYHHHQKRRQPDEASLLEV